MTHENPNMTQMNSSEATQSRAGSYAIELLQETLPDGKLVFVAQHPDLLGCLATGDTAEQAVQALHIVRAKYIAHYLAHGLPLPNSAPTESDNYVHSRTSDRRAE